MRSLFLASVYVLIAVTPAAADTIVIKAGELELKGSQDFAAHISLAFDTKTSLGRARIAAAYLGKGANFWGHDKSLSTQCVAFDPAAIINAPTAEGSASADNWISLNQVSTLTDHFRSESLGASANVTYKIFSLGASGSATSANHFRSTSLYIDIDKGVVSDSFLIAELPGMPRLHLESGIGKEDFARVCGQAYIWKVSFGTTVKGTIDFDVNVNADTSTNKAAVSAGITGIISGSVDTAKTWSDLSKVSSIKYRIQGGPTESDNKADWIPRLKAWGSSPADAQSNDVIIYHTIPYRTLLDAGDVADVNVDALGTLTNLQWGLTDSVQKLSDRQNALSDMPHVATDPAVIRGDVLKLSDYVDGLQAVYKTCSEALKPQDVAGCRKAAKDAGLPPQVTELTYK